ncbi:MAG: transcription antitermination factor NusB [Candidatus Omnitrophica bacterium]|nr:transcription antitermination factor NusB [Candidatus Omnitrophota bacterium]
MRKRTKGREEALKILYQAEITRRPVTTASDNYWELKEKYDSTVRNFSNRIVVGVEEFCATIDEMISKYATNWQLKRMAVIDRNILRMGVFELMYANDIPPKVTINEAVELAKKYGDTESSKFVNGILDKIHKTELLTKKEVKADE